MTNNNNVSQIYKKPGIIPTPGQIQQNPTSKINKVKIQKKARTFSNPGSAVINFTQWWNWDCKYIKKPG